MNRLSSHWTTLDRRENRSSKPVLEAATSSVFGAGLKKAEIFGAIKTIANRGKRVSLPHSMVCVITLSHPRQARITKGL